MMRRLMLGVLMLVMGLMWGGTVGAQDIEAHYQKALRLIERAGRTKATELDLSALFLTTLPPELLQLTNLQILHLDSNQLTSLPPEIGQLTNLQSLSLGWNQVTSLPPEISQLSNLRNLSLDGTQLITLPAEIGQLTQLQYLGIPYTYIATLPVELGQLTNLQRLNLYNTPVTFPPPEIIAQGTPTILAYLRDYKAMLMHQTIAGIAAGVGGIAAIMLAFRWRQRRGLSEKKKRA